MPGFHRILLSTSLLVAMGCGRGPGQNTGPHGAGGAGGFGSGGSDVGGATLGGLDPLPPPATIDTDLFSTADRCAFCHTASGSALVDAAGRDISPYRLWRGSMMGFSGRDPYWLAALSHELADNPGAKDTIEAACTRCHAPAGAVTRASEAPGGHLGFDDITAGTSAAAHLGREGVGCATCHQIEPTGLGQPSSFTGNYQIGANRLMYGPHQNPFTMPMKNQVNFTPTYATHITDSGLCATCHTVITRALDESGQPTGPEVPEQVPYLEWQNSSFSAGPSAVGCIGCHMPTRDEDGESLSTRISNRPPWLDPRSPVGRHILAGGNAYMLRLIAENAAWTGTDVPQEDILEGERHAKAMLGNAAKIEIASATRANGELTLDVAVHNDSGHKFPTAYPSRRAWIRLTVKNTAGAVIFESGGFDARGALVDGSGKRLDGEHVVLPHHDQITSDVEVQVYESVLADASGAPTHVLLRATKYIKDNRLLPSGWSAAHPSAGMTKPVGIGDDQDFGPAIDHIEYRVKVPAGALEVTAELFFQTVPPTTADVLSKVETSAAKTFTSMMTARPPLPVQVAAASASVP